MDFEFILPDDLVPACHASTIALSSSGLVVSFFAGTREGDADVGIWVSIRRDSGWTVPTEVANGVVSPTQRHPCWNPVLFQVPNGPLLLFYKVGPTCSAWWGMLTTSDDGGQTWSKPERLPENVLGPIKNKPVQLADGSLLCPSSDESAGWHVRLERTSDLGRTWETVGPLNDADLIDAIQPTILCHAGGWLQLLCRTKQGFIGACWSDDGGITWDPMRLTELPNPNSGIDAVVLRDGRALLVYNHSGKRAGEWGGPRSPLNLATSPDGRRWQSAVVLESEPGEYSYPAMIQTPDGRVHVTYTWNRTNVRHCALEPREISASLDSHGP